MRIKNVSSRLKQLESKLPDLESFNKQKRNEVIKEVTGQATVTELRIATRSGKHGEVSEKESQEMLETLSKRADELLKKK